MKSQSHIKKICIGTAQFGSKYGISNLYGKTKRAEAKKIIHLAKLNQINFFDTANDYGESQKIIGSSNSKNKKIVSKAKRTRQERLTTLCELSSAPSNNVTM